MKSLHFTTLKSQKFYVAIVVLLCSIFTKTYADNITWHIQSVTGNAIVLSGSLNSSSNNILRTFAFTTRSDLQCSYALNIKQSAGNETAQPVTKSSTGWYGNYYLQWLTFNIPPNKPGAPYTGTLNITFDQPILQSIPEGSIKIENGILIIPLESLPVLKKTSSIPLQFNNRIGLRIEVENDGIYKVTGKMLQDAGVPIASISSITYQLFEKDREIPILLSNNMKQVLTLDDYFLFYGKGLKKDDGTFEQFSNTSVYHLFWDGRPGVRIALTNGDRRKDPTDYSTGISIKAQEFYDTLHIEYDNDIRWLGNATDIPPTEITTTQDAKKLVDNWYWGIIGDNTITSFVFNIPSPARTGPARISVDLMGLTSIDSIQPDHTFEIYLNNNPAGAHSSARWDGQREYLFVSDTFSSTNLLNGNNKISVIASGTFLDRCALNWINIEYKRDYKVFNDNLLFKNSPDAPGKVIEYELDGFTLPDIDLWDIDRNRSFTDFTTKAGNGNSRNTYTLQFQDSITQPVHYFAQLINKRSAPSAISLDTFSTGWDSLTSIDYIIIAPDSFYQDCVPLMAMHRQQGLKTAFVSINQIYNCFSWGIRDPEAIRQFLKFCYSKNPSHPPRYVLLCGDTSHDLDKKNKHLNIVPTHLSRITGWGPGADDGYFATVNGDDLFPDLCIGRFPARNRVDLQVMVSKTINYSTKSQPGFWKDNCLLLGGGEAEFTQFNDEISANTIGPSMNIIRMDADPDSRFYTDAQVAQKAIADQLNAGVFILNFNGHGGGNIWSDNDFFGYNDLSRLYNGTGNRGGRLPIVFSFTCLTGFFESTTYRSLGEEFLRNSEHGAICFYGASAYTSRNGNVAMNRIMFESALQDTFNTIGSLINYCEMDMLVQYGSQYINLVQQYNLLGDPALPLKFTPDTMDCKLGNTLLQGSDSLIINGITNPAHDGLLHIEVQSSDQKWYRSTDQLKGRTFSKSIPAKAGSHTANGTVRVYAWNDSSEVRRYLSFSKDSIMVTDLQLTPAIPAIGDSVNITCRVTGDTTSQVYCLYAIAKPSVNPSFSGIRMSSEGNGLWKTTEPVTIVASEYNDLSLILKFRVTSQDASKESEQFKIPVASRPDLSFTSSKLKLFWLNDSLRTRVQILNSGNKTINTFKAVITLNSGGITQDTVKIYNFTNPLPPAGIITDTFAIPDVKNDIVLTVHISSTEPEISLTNNICSGSFFISQKILSSSTDTLYSKFKGVYIHPSSNFTQPHTVFLFADSIPESAPLKNNSKWISLQGDSIKMVSIGCRPPLSKQDSLSWNFRLSNDSTRSQSQSTGNYKVMLYDQQLSHWKALLYNINRTINEISCITGFTGPYAVSSIDDSDGPDIQVSVFGRTLDFVDYAAKDNPFSIMISDLSELNPMSISLLLNNKQIPASGYSQIPMSGDLEHISLTAYPQSNSALDSLTIQASDFAGNSSSRTFAYMPGKDLSIQFFACHPNPFTAKLRPDGSQTFIRFSYCITDVAESIKLVLYTISGRPIKTWDFSNLIGYQEIVWDGHDNDGYRLANGTYYAKLTVKNKKKSAKKIIKIAKLEGY